MCVAHQGRLYRWTLASLTPVQLLLQCTTYKTCMSHWSNKCLYFISSSLIPADFHGDRIFQDNAPNSFTQRVHTSDVCVWCERWSFVATVYQQSIRGWGEQLHVSAVAWECVSVRAKRFGVKPTGIGGETEHLPSRGVRAQEHFLWLHCGALTSYDPSFSATKSAWKVIRGDEHFVSFNKECTVLFLAY